MNTLASSVSFFLSTKGKLIHKDTATEAVHVLFRTYPHTYTHIHTFH